MRTRSGGYICVLLMAVVFGNAIAQDKQCAVVLMHGKWGNTQYISFFGNRLEPYCEYKAIEMPWSKRRNYDEPYPVALAEIKAQVVKFREQGFKRVFVSGHSFGANASLAYVAEIGDADGVILLAPGHVPGFMYKNGIGRDAVDKARELVASGKGDETLWMDDLNQGRRASISMKASVLLSYFDPDGLGNMAKSASSFKKPVPVLYVIGTSDPLYKNGADFVFNKIPSHPSSKYVVVQADHSGTPEAAVDQVLDWIKSLP